MSAPAWGNDGRSRKAERKGEPREKPTGEIGARQLEDMYFDGAITPAARRVLEEKVRTDKELRAEFRATRDLIEKLRRPIPCPDQTDEILRRVAGVNGFASSKARRKIWGVRFGVAACFGAVLGTVVVVRHFNPPAVPWAQEQQSAASNDAAPRLESANGVRTFASAVDSLTHRTGAPLGVGAPQVPARRESLEMNGVSKYGTSLTWGVATVPPSPSGRGIDPGTVAVFRPDAGEVAMAAPASALGGIISKDRLDHAKALENADILLKVDRPWWLWQIDELPDKPVANTRKPKAR